MKYLTVLSSPKLTINRTNRCCVIDELTDLITVTESTLKLELTLPSFLQGLKDGFYQLFGDIFLAGVQVYA